MNRFFTTILLLVCFIASQFSHAQVTMVTDCSDLYLVRMIQMLEDRDQAYASFTYDKDRHATSLTQGYGSETSTLDIKWTASKITYTYLGFEILTAQLDEKGNTVSMTNYEGLNLTCNYEDGYLVSYIADRGNEHETCQIKWQDGNPVEVKITDERNHTVTSKFTYSDIPNNTNIDFGILQNTDFATFALPMGKGVKNLPAHLDYDGIDHGENNDLTYEFDALNRPVKAINNGRSWEQNKTKDFTKTLIISYDESFIPLSITKPTLVPGLTSQSYNIMGQKVSNGHKGLVIRCGQKYIVK